MFNAKINNSNKQNYGKLVAEITESGRIFQTLATLLQKTFFYNQV